MLREFLRPSLFQIMSSGQQREACSKLLISRRTSTKTCCDQHCACWWSSTNRCQGICRHSDDCRLLLESYICTGLSLQGLTLEQLGHFFKMLFYFPMLFTICVIFFSCDQAALQMVFSVRPSVCLSVRPSVCHTFFTMFPSSYHHEIFRSYYHGQKWCPCKRSRSEVKGQGHRGQHPT